MGTVPDCLGRPQAEARELLQAVGLKFSEEITRPTRDFFQIDDSSLYVVRQLLLTDGTVHLTLAARMAKEVSFHGL